MKRTTRSAFTLIEIMIVVAIIGLLASIAIPNLKEAIDRSRAQACNLNRKNIDAAKLRWALANNQPTDATPTEQDLFGQEALIEHKPNCPAGGAYALNAVQERCTCNVIKHANKLGE
jgi:prepilin-type N-terminal cleavage/methylation domain-containing protein